MHLHPDSAGVAYSHTIQSLVFGMVEGERRPGRPVRRWIDDILMWCGQDVQKATMMTVDRDNWLVATVLADYGTGVKEEEELTALPRSPAGFKKTFHGERKGRGKGQGRREHME